MKAGHIILVLLSLLLFAGCESVPETVDIPVHLGMPRKDVKAFYGEPLRIVRLDSGGEDWYYVVVAWKTNREEANGYTNDFGETSTYASVGWELSRETKEYPIHISPNGYVISPLPPGKVAKP